MYKLTLAHTHVYLSSSCLERPPPKPIPQGLVLNKKYVWPTLSEFKIPSWQFGACLHLKDKCHKWKFSCLSGSVQLQRNNRQDSWQNLNSVTLASGIFDPNFILFWLLYNSLTHSELAKYEEIYTNQREQLVRFNTFRWLKICYFLCKFGSKQNNFVFFFHRDCKSTWFDISLSLSASSETNQPPVPPGTDSLFPGSHWLQPKPPGSIVSLLKASSLTP